MDNLAEAAAQFAQDKVEQLFAGKGYTADDLGVIKSALEVGFISGVQAEHKYINERIDAVLSGRTQ